LAWSIVWITSFQASVNLPVFANSPMAWVSSWMTRGVWVVNVSKTHVSKACFWGISRGLSNYTSKILISFVYVIDIGTSGAARMPAAGLARIGGIAEVSVQSVTTFCKSWWYLNHCKKTRYVVLQFLIVFSSRSKTDLVVTNQGVLELVGSIW
jgi:hypothetical protein